MKKVFFVSTIVFFAFLNAQQAPVLNDDAYFEVEDLKSHPLYSKKNEEALIQKGIRKSNEGATAGSRSYGQTYNDRFSNFNSYSGGRWCSPYLSNFQRRNMMFYNVNPNFDYGMGLDPWCNPNNGINNGLMWDPYIGYFDPMFMNYNQIFYCPYGNPYANYGNNFNNNNNNNNNGGWSSTPKPKVAPSNRIVNQQPVYYNSTAPQNVSSPASSRSSSSSSTSEPTTRPTNTDEGTNVWRSTRSTDNSAPASTRGTENRTESSGGGTGRRR